MTLENNDWMTDEEILIEAIDGECDFLEIVRDEEMSEGGRWSNYYDIVVKHIGTGSFYQIDWEVGATEYQDVDFEPIVTQVYPKEVTTTIYTTENEGNN